MVRNLKVARDRVKRISDAQKGATSIGADAFWLIVGFRTSDP